MESPRMSKNSRLAFCLFKYFPFGGLQRDLLQIAEACMTRGHQVDIYAGDWKGKVPDGFNVEVLPVRGLTNHRRCESFAKRLPKHLKGRHYNAVVGFNKMPGLDVYFAADPCFAHRVSARSLLYRLTGRCRSYMSLEEAVFERESKTEILLISEKEEAVFVEYYGTAEQRFHLLPPGISKDFMDPDISEHLCVDLRQELGIGSDAKIILMVGSGFKTKGVDRAILSLASLPLRLRENTVLLVVGEDKSRPFERLSRRMGVAGHVRFVGGRRDVPRFLVAADLLLHPAYRENTGTVLIEAMAAGLPVLATDVCGYGHYIERSQAGELIPAPFRQETLNQMLASMLISDEKDLYRRNGRKYIGASDVFSLAEKAADIIEQVAT